MRYIWLIFRSDATGSCFPLSRNVNVSSSVVLATRILNSTSWTRPTFSQRGKSSLIRMVTAVG